MDLLSLSKTNVNSSPLVSYLSRSFKAKEHSTSLAMARAIGYSKVLPESKLDYAYSGYFNTKYLIDVRQSLSSINEVVIIDHATIVHYAAQFYEVRCTNALNELTEIKNFFIDPITELFGISNSFSLEDLEVIKNNYADFIKVHNLTVEWLQTTK